MRKVEFADLSDVLGMEVYTERGTEDMLRYVITHVEIQNLAADLIEALDRITQDGRYYVAASDDPLPRKIVVEISSLLERLSKEGRAAQEITMEPHRGS